MRKGLMIFVCAAMLAAVISLGITFAGKRGAENKLSDVSSQLTETEARLAEATALLESSAKKAEEELSSVKTAADEAAKAAADELEQTKQALQLAQEQVQRTELELADMLRRADELAVAKEKAENEARAAADELDRIRKAVTAVMNGTVTEEEVPIARILFESADHTARAYSQDFTPGVTASVADVQGEGTYTVGLTFDTPAQGLYFMTLCIENAETQYPGWVIDVLEALVNGQPIDLGKTYTTSDDGLRTRVNLFNEWETKLPEDARGVSADLADASAVPVNPEAFDAVTSIEIRFDYLSPETVAARQAEAAAALEAEQAEPAEEAEPVEAPAEGEAAQPAEGAQD